MITLDEAIEILSRPKTMKGTPQDILEAHNMAITALRLIEDGMNGDEIIRQELKQKCWLPPKTDEAAKTEKDGAHNETRRRDRLGRYTS